jgi:hypothetical protein
VELFEILFILFFILIPIFEGLRKSRQRQEAERDVEVAEEAETGSPPDYHVPPAPGRPEPATGDASDMVPDDLWEILTGERRPRSDPGAEPRPEWDDQEAVEVESAPRTWWEEDAEAEAPEPDLEPVMEERFEPAPWRIEPVPPPPPAEVTVEAYSPLIHREATPAPPRPRRLSLRELSDEPPPTVREPSALVRALGSQEGLRQAILLREILGPPKGLDS